MKKRGILAFIVYIFGCLWAARITILAYIESQSIIEPDVENWGAFGVAIMILLAMIIGIPSVIGFVLKLLHLASHKKLFAILCILLDLVMLLYLAGIHQIFIYGFDHWVGELGVYFLWALVPLFALISNTRSLAD